ncbi:MAG TPA: permease [Myxococcales bacterium]|nr:permease [Myxococcales bacterium]
MQSFLETWAQAAYTSVGLFWMAFWAFALGYLISSMIQVFVTRQRMKRAMGETGPKSVALGTFFGFISSSCSFAALSTTRALFTKGAGLVPALAFMLASTNLVVELGIVIAIFLGWQFVVGEYVGGVLLILLMWVVVRATLPESWEEQAREHAEEQEGSSDDRGEEPGEWKERLTSRDGWRDVAETYVGEWKMVWKDVTVGFTVAGVIAAFVPPAFFEALFVGAGAPEPAFWQVLIQSLVGPVAAFFTFIGSMGNIPLAAVLFGNGVSFAGVIAFIFSDLVVFPVLRIQAKYYGWKMALYLIGVLFVVLVASALALHYGFAIAGMLPDPASAKSVTDRQHFSIDYGFFLNLGFLALSAVFLGWKWRHSGPPARNMGSPSERILFWLSMLALVWLGGGLAARLLL